MGDLGQPVGAGRAHRGWAIYPGVGFIGIVFAVVWFMIVYLRGEVLRRQKRGLLPGQQAPRD